MLRGYAVHPRVRGEHARIARMAVWDTGSSPRTRGTPAQAQLPCACALVHPRVRGEHDIGHLVCERGDGSSPRTRGTRWRRSSPRTVCRFIPAYAGNTKLLTVKIYVITVHPRVRGEHAATRLRKSSGAGSSPRTRGTRYIAVDASGLFTVHPRVRGEHGVGRQGLDGGGGSSPRTRGTLIGAPVIHT